MFDIPGHTHPTERTLVNFYSFSYLEGVVEAHKEGVFDVSEHPPLDLGPLHLPFAHDISLLEDFHGVEHPSALPSNQHHLTTKK